MMEQDSSIIRDLLKTIFLTSFLFLWLHWLWSRRNIYRFAMKFPGSFGYPIIGSLLTIKHFKYMLRGVGILIERCKNHTICIWLGVCPTIVSADPEFIGKVLSSSELLNKAKVLYKPLHDVLGGGIIASHESVWRHNRKMINPSFDHKVLVSFLPVFHRGKQQILSLMDSMVDNNEHKLFKILQMISLHISLETTMGAQMEPGGKISDGLIEKYNFISKNVMNGVTLSLIKVFFIYAKYNNVKQYLHNVVSGYVNLRLQKLKVNPSCTNKDIGDSLVSIKKSHSIFIDQAIQIYQQHKFTLNDIMAESNTILAASFDTTANGLFSALVMLATHPDIQERLFNEIVNVFPEKDFEMEFAHVKQLPYLDMVINETLRLAPSVPIIGRHVDHDTQLTKELNLPKGLQVIISIFHLHRRKDIWGANANKFDPDHFLPENLSGKHAYSYIPFSKGIRNCIGWRYALFSLKVILCGIIRNYRLTTNMKYEDLEYIAEITIKLLNEPLFQIHRREI